MIQLLQNVPDAKILFAADLHVKRSFSAALPTALGDSRYGLASIVATAKARKAGLVIFGGDIFDKNILREADLVTEYQEAVEELHAAGILSAAYYGNHDRVYAAPGVMLRQWYECHPRVININNQTFTVGSRVCHAIGYCDTVDEFAAEMAKVPETVTTLFLHQFLKGVGLPTFNCDEDLFPPHIIEVYVGDIHGFYQGINVHGAVWAYPGPMFPQEFGETDCGLLEFPAQDPVRGAASWQRLRLPFRPMKVAEMYEAHSNPGLMDIVQAELLEWAESQSSPLMPIVQAKFLTTDKDLATSFRRKMQEGNKLLVALKFEAADDNGKLLPAMASVEAIPNPLELVDDFVASQIGPQGKHRNLRRPEHSVDILKALLALKPQDESEKGRQMVYRNVLKAAVDRITPDRFVGGADAEK